VGCDPKDDDNYAIRWAAENGHLNVSKYLKHLEPSSKPDELDELLAIMSDKFDIFKGVVRDLIDKT
jgi:hypothetical protein